MIRKGQARRVSGADVWRQIQFIYSCLIGLAAVAFVVIVIRGYTR